MRRNSLLLSIVLLFSIAAQLSHAETYGNEGIVFTGAVWRNATAVCDNCTLTIAISGVNGTGVTDKAGQFAVLVPASVAPGQYLLDIQLDDGMRTLRLGKRIDLS